MQEPRRRRRENRTSLNKRTSRTSRTSGNDFLAAAASTAPTAHSLGEHARLYVQRVRGGDMGSLPAVGGLIVLVILFSIVQDTFASNYNFGNMLTEGPAPALLAMGLVFVLLLGEIDLSAGYAAGGHAGGRADRPGLPHRAR